MPEARELLYERKKKKKKLNKSSLTQPRLSTQIIFSKLKSSQHMPSKSAPKYSTNYVPVPHLAWQAIVNSVSLLHKPLYLPDTGSVSFHLASFQLSHFKLEQTYALFLQCTTSCGLPLWALYTGPQLCSLKKNLFHSDHPEVYSTPTYLLA